MKTTIVLLLTGLFSQFALITFNIKAQVLVNEVWATSSGQPDETNFPLSEWDNINWTSSVTTNADEIITVGNVLQATGNTDILVTKQDSTGLILWEQTFAGATESYDYGLAVTLDNNENIIVAGVVTTNNETTDIALLKYAPAGTLLWSSITDGGNDLFDLPTALVTDANNNIYLAGGTMSLITLSDWYVAKFNSEGIQLWNITYNYANLHELPINIELNDDDNVTVGGFSNSSVTVWDFTTLKLSSVNGMVLLENRTEIPELSITDVVEIVSDENNNIYLAGSTTLTTGNIDMQLVKINSDFDIEWVRKVDAEGLEDKNKSMTIDNDGNILIAGNSKKTNNGTQITLSRFTPQGDLTLSNKYLAPQTFQKAEVSKIKVNQTGDIFVVGSAERNGNKDFVTLMYDNAGNLRVEKFFSGNNDAILPPVNRYSFA